MPNRPGRTVIRLLVLLAAMFTIPAAFGQDLTPSVNYFNFDYAAVPTSDRIDSIVGCRYEALVADNSYGTGYVDKYNDYVRYTSNLEIYCYLDFSNANASSAGAGYVNEVVGALMEAAGSDSTNMYWHSADRTQADWGYYDAYNTSEFGSRLRTYYGTRFLTNTTDPVFVQYFVDEYVRRIKDKHGTAKNFDLTGLWFDNMGLPQTMSVSSSNPDRHMWEDDLGAGAQYGGESWSDWHAAYRDVVLLEGTKAVAERMESQLGMKLCINAIGWGHGLGTAYSYGYQPSYFDGSVAAPVSREHEFCGNAYHGDISFYPGPSNSVSTFDSATVAAHYYPGTMYKGMVSCSQADVEHWFNPAQGETPYGWCKRYYDCLALYYLWRSRTTFLSFSNGPNSGVLNWIDGGSDGACVHAGETNDTCYWIGAVGERVGRDGYDWTWDSDTVQWYAASVACPSALIENVGKDNAGQNYVVFMRRWTGDDGYRYMTLVRPPSRNQNTFGGSEAPAFELLEGPWEKMDIDGYWDSPIWNDSLRNGEGAIYRASFEGDGCAVPPPAPYNPSLNGGVEAPSLQPSLCVNNSAPVDGCDEPYIYTFELFYDPQMTLPVMSPVSVTEGSGTTCFTPLTPLETGRYYWWRVRSNNGTAFSPWAGLYYFHTTNTPPSTPPAAEPEDGAAVEVTRPTLSVDAVTDPDGTQVAYEFQVSKFSNFSSMAAETWVTGSDAQVSWQVPTPLENGSVYYWRSRSSDGIDTSNYCDNCSFSVAVSGNSAPYAPILISPLNGSTTSMTSPELVVQNGTDDDGDPLTYTFELWDASQSGIITSASGIPSGSQSTNWTVDVTLDYQTDYQWRARCFDGIDYSDWMGWAGFTTSAADAGNSAPTIPVPLLPDNGTTVSNTPIVLTVENSTDADGDSLLYDFFVYSDAGVNNMVTNVRNVQQQPIHTSAILEFTPVNGQTYYWRCWATDHDEYSEFSTVTNFRYVQLSVDADEFATAARPEPGSVVHSATPTLHAGNVPGFTDYHYYFDISTDSGFVSPTVSSPGIPSELGATTSWKVTERLETGTTYFWRVRADATDYSSVSWFTVDEIIYASPNPVRFSESPVTFHLPTRPVDLLIQTVSGQTVLIKDGISGEWQWDGRNASGNRVAVGIYPWFIRGSDYNGKIVVKP